MFFRSFVAFFSQFKISYRLWIGFGILVLLLLIISITAMQSLSKASSGLSDVVEVNLPAVLESMELAETLQRANSALGFFLLSKNDTAKSNYLESLQQIDTQILNLINMPSIKENPESLQKVEKIALDLKKYNSYKERMVELAKSINNNQPGRAFMEANLPQDASDIQQNLTQMMALDELDLNEEGAEEKIALLVEIANLRQIWMNILIANRAFLAFRAQLNLDNNMLYRQAFIDKLSEIEAQEDVLGFEQSEAIAVIKERMVSYFKNQDKMFEIHGGDKWRTDAYLMQHEIAPLVQDIKDNIAWLVKNLRDTSEQEASSLVSQVEATTGLVSLLLIAGLVFGLGGSYILSCLITSPLNSTVNAMEDIAEGEGDLTRRLMVRGRDEIAQLSIGFNNFIEKIQNTIQQVAGSTLQINSAAEKMSLVSNEASNGVQKQRSETGQVAAAMAKMTDMVQEVAHARSICGGFCQSSRFTGSGRT